MKSTNLVHLYGLMSLEGALLGAEFVASQLTHSLIILTDAYHTLYNIINILLLVISFKMSKEQTVKNTFGWARIDVLGKLVNMTFVVALTVSLLVEGIQQLVHASHEISEPTNYYLLFIFGVCGLISNLLYFNIAIGAVVNQAKPRAHSLQLQKGITSDTPSCSQHKKHLSDVGENLLAIQCIKEKEITFDEKKVGKNSSRNTLVGLTGDLSSSLLLIICGIVVINTDGNIAHLADPILGIIAAILFCISFYRKMKNTGLILLQTVPENINVEQLRKDILNEFPVILNIHDLHIWGLTASRIIATCHIILPKQSSKSYERFSSMLEKFFQRQGISLATVQPEFHETNTQLSTFSCLMKCSKISQINCDSFACCKNDEIDANDQMDSQHFEEVVTTENL